MHVCMCIFNKNRQATQFVCFSAHILHNYIGIIEHVLKALLFNLNIIVNPVYKGTFSEAAG